MTSTPVKLKVEPDEQVVVQSPWRLALRRYRQHRMALFGTVVLVAIVLYILIGSIVYSEADANYNDAKLAFLAPGSEHPFGTDVIGRDVLARTVYGGQISLFIGFLSVLVSVTLGTLVGALSGYYGGWVDTILMRITEAMLSIPVIMILLLLAKIFGGKIDPVVLFGRRLDGSVLVIVLIIGLTSWMTLARIVRSRFLSLKEAEFVLAAHALGIPNWRIILVHILPNTVAQIVVAATLGVAGAILQESYISFLGLGVQNPTASWGNMLNGATRYLQQAPWLWIFPGLLLLLSVLSINFIGDGLRDALDPRGDKKT